MIFLIVFVMMKQKFEEIYYEMQAYYFRSILTFKLICQYLINLNLKSIKLVLKL